MASENIQDAQSPQYTEAYYEEKASEEEIYLEDTEETLRAKLLSDTPEISKGTNTTAHDWRAAS